MQEFVHSINPIYDDNSKILFLGSFPSEKSREKGYPYAHPRNRFWDVLSYLFNEKITNHKDFLLRHNIALWDVVKRCKIKGSSDSSITTIEVNDINKIIKKSQIKQIFTTGTKAYQLYMKHLYEKTNIKPINLSSTSPANATKNLTDLIEEYKIIKKYL